MDREEFESLIDKNKHQFFIFGSMTNLFAFFSKHTWIVTNRKGEIDRWDVWHKKERCKTSKGFVHKNFYPPWKGTSFLPTSISSKTKLRTKAKVIAKLEGDDKSMAKKMIEFVHENAWEYPLFDRFSLIGPNCNSFTGWVLSKFPDSGIRLPISSIGRNYCLKG